MKTLLLFLSLMCITFAAQGQQKKIKTVKKDTVRMANGKQIVATSISYDYVEVGDQVPYFEVTRDDNRLFNIDDFRGKTILVSFWISTCESCSKELKRVKKELIDAYGKNNKFAFIAIGNNEDIDAAKRLKVNLGLDFFLFCDENGDVASNFFDNFAHPVNYVINPDGKIVMISKGFDETKFILLKAKISETINNFK